MSNEDRNFCPFLHNLCRADCVFHTRRIATADGVFTCLIAAKLSDINPQQYDQLTEITKYLNK